MTTTTKWGVTTASAPTTTAPVPRGGAAEALAGLRPGGRVVGVTRGQFSLVDLLRAALDITGPADVTIAAWTSGIRDADTAAWLLRSGKIRSLRWLLDRSFLTRQPKYAAEVRRMFGADALVETNTHAKFLLIGNERWRVVVRSSMNLNRNTRLEQFDVDDNPAIYEFFNGVGEEVAGKMGTGLGKPTETVDAKFEQLTLGWSPAAETAFAPAAGGEWLPGVVPGV